MKHGLSEAKIRVLFVTATTIGGGAERMLFNIIRSLDNNHSKRLFVTSDELVPEVYNNRVETVNADKKHAIAAFPKLLSEIKNYKPKHIFTTSSNIGYLLVIAKKLLRVNFKVYIRCAVTPSEIYQTNLKSRLLRKINNWAYKNADLIIAQTDFMRNDLMSAYNLKTGKVRTIRNIVDINFITEQSNKNQHLELEPNNYNIVAVGALYSVKGFDILIDAVTPIILENRKVYLYIIGEERYEAGYKDYLQKKIDEAGLSSNILLLGHKANPYPYFKGANLFVMSSRKEGFPNVVLEALALHTPVVVTDVVDWTGIIDEGINGYIAEKNNIESLSTAIKRGVYDKPIISDYRLQNFDYNGLFN